MKKRSLWILFMAALLCLTMLFAACTSESDIEETSGTDTEAPETESDTDAATETETETEPETEATPKDEDIDYSAIIAEWNKYLSLAEPDNEDTFTSSTYMYQVYTQNIDGVQITQTLYGDIAAVTTRYDAVYNTNVAEGTPPLLVTPVRTSTRFFNVRTGAQLIPNPVSQTEYVHEIHTFQNDYEYRIYANSIIEITLIKYEQGELDGVPTWIAEPTVKYSYYDANGVALATNLEKRATYYEDINCVEIAGKNYYCQNGEIIFATDDVYPHKLPNFGEEYNGYKYYADLQNRKIQVVDTSTYRLVVDYNIPNNLAIDDVVCNVLSGGDIYLFALEKIDDNSLFFDVEFKDVPNCEDGLYNVHHIIISVSTGKANKIEADFATVNLFTKAQSEFSGIDFNGDYQYADIFRIEDRKLSAVPESVILDDTLKEVAKLPNIFKNQYGIEGAMGSKLLVNVKNFTTGYETTFVADMVLETVSQYIQTGNAVEKINNGYIIDNKVYNFNFEELLDLSDLNYTVRNGNLYIVETVIQEENIDDGTEQDTTGETDTDVGGDEPVESIVYKVVYVSSDGEREENTISVDNEPIYTGVGLYRVVTENYYDWDYVTNVSLYNARGECISTYPDIDALEILFDGSVIAVRSDNKISYYSIK